MQGPGETGETWTYPSMVLVPLCTVMVMAWSLQGDLWLKFVRLKALSNNLLS